MKFSRYRVGLAIFGLLTLTLTAADEPLPLNIQVRAEVDQPFTRWGREKIKEHSKVYDIVAIEETPSEVPLVRPIDQEVVLKHLGKELAQRGFRPAAPGEAPGIILTVHCGRGYLRNPYLKGVLMDETTEPPTASIMGLQTHLINSRTAFHEQRLQEAQSEKLFIRVSAWANPASLPEPKPGQRQKPKLLWKTTMVTDDPAHRDLNQFVEKMLAAGADFFDRTIKDPEAFVTTDLPEGFIKYGNLKVVRETEPADAGATHK
ncbi:MAG: hypothetical protein IT582_01080 [Opitutaceae bacterium]|nr:hypothetical protein [Opitutaceae bacterium]